MRILVISTCSARTPPDGFGPCEEVAYDLAVELAAAGHDVVVFATADSPVDLPLAYHFGSPPTYSPEHQAAHAAAAIAYANKEHFDVVHNNEANHGALLAHKIRWPTVTRMNWYPHENFYRQLRTLDAPAKFVAISHRMREALHELPFADTIHNGIDIAGFPYVERKEDYLLYLGRIIPQKGVDQAIEVARQAGLPLVIAGQLLPRHQDYFNQQVRPAVDGKDVEWYGAASRPQAKELLAGARALVMPYRWEEPFGKVLVEAQACGTPVVSVPVGAVPEVVADGVTGYLRETPAQMAAAVRQLGSISPRACRERSVELFSRARMAADYARLYRRLAAG